MIESIITFAIIIYVALICRLIYKIVMDYDNNNPIKTIGWIMAVWILPIIGPVLYVVIGRNLNKKRSYLKRLNDEIKNHGYFQYGFDPNEIVTDKLLDKYRYLKTLLKNLYPLPIFANNDVRLFNHGTKKFDALFDDMRAAKSHIHVLYYTIGDDDTGQAFKNILLKKKKEGLEVRLMYDDMGCNETHKSYFKELEKAGVELSVFSPVSFPKMLHTVNYRNHKKIVVIDGKIGYTGGINVKDDYTKNLDWGIWRDVSLRIEGSATQGLQTIFFIDWFYTCNQFLFDDKYYPVVDSYGNNLIQVVSAEPIDQFKNIEQGMIEAIARAEKTVYIETPYFVPNDSMLTAIQNAGLSGLDVRIILPKRSDNKKVQRAANSYVMQLLSSKVKVYQYLPGFIHSKLIIIDNDLTIAGSSNMDIRSFELNFETSVFIYNKDTAEEAKKIFMIDLDDSEYIDKIEWKNRSWRTKFVESVYRLFSPLL